MRTMPESGPQQIAPMDRTAIEGRFNGRTAIVTGGAQGIGREIAQRIAVEGGSVVIADINPEVGEAAAGELADSGLSVAYEAVNVADEDDARRMVSRAASVLEGVDILINNAGITGRERTFLKMPDLSEHGRILAVNLLGPMACTHAVLPIMKENGYGRIVSASSIVAKRGNVGQTGYAAAKAGLIGFSNSLAKEVGRYGITSNVVAPGFTQTAMMEVVPDEKLTAIANMTPVGRLGRPEEIAGMYAYLASEEAGFVTGRVFEIDGGLPL